MGSSIYEIELLAEKKKKEKRFPIIFSLKGEARLLCIAVMSTIQYKIK